MAERYAGALFELARESDQVESVERALDAFLSLVRSSADLRRFVVSPAFSQMEQRQGLMLVLKQMGIEGIARDFLLLLAKNRRLFAVEAIIKSFKSLAAQARGEVEAEIVSAVPLTTEQLQDLTDTLRQRLGKTPRVTAAVDPKLLGGLVMRVGSRMIDTSLRTKLKNLEKALKEAS